MSNEWSASVPTLEHDGRAVNHQWSKSAAFEASFRALLQADPAGLPDYFSALRDRTELWVAERFAALTQYHSTFRSCNRAFHIDTSEAARPLVRSVRQVLLHRPDPGPVHVGGAAQGGVRRDGGDASR